MAACALTLDIDYGCRTGVGGVKEIYIIPNENISTMTEASGVITALTKVTGKRFFKYSLPKETSSATEAISGSEANGTVFFTQTVNIVINRRSGAIRNEIMLLAQNRLTIIVVQNNLQAFMYGKTSGLLLNAGEAATGTNWGDRNGYTLPFSGNEIELAPEVASNLIAALTTPG